MEILDSAQRVAALLSPLRRRLLAHLERPQSASSLARLLDLPRQKVNYHLRELEKEGFVELVEERQRRGCTERIVRATARGYLIDPALLGEPEEQAPDQLSAAYLMVTAARAMRDVAVLRRRAQAAGKKLATFTAEADVRFASPDRLVAFQQGLAAALAHLASKYGDPAAPEGRRYRFLLAGLPAITKTDEEAEAELSAAAQTKGMGVEK